MLELANLVEDFTSHRGLFLVTEVSDIGYPPQASLLKETKIAMEITKAEESLKAADLCYSQGLYNSSASRGYYAMFQAAQVALEAAGFTRPEWSHAGLHATFATSSLDGESNMLLPLLAI